MVKVSDLRGRRLAESTEDERQALTEVANRLIGTLAQAVAAYAQLVVEKDGK